MSAGESPFPRMAIVVSRYNGAVTSRMVDGAREALAARHAEASPAVVEAPGAFELPVIAAGLAGRADVDGVVCLGCVIRGETVHDRVIADAIAGELVALGVRTGKPVAFGVLTCDTIEQAEARAGGAKGNKGAEAMDAALDTFEQLRAVRATPSLVGAAHRIARDVADKSAGAAS